MSWGELVLTYLTQTFCWVLVKKAFQPKGPSSEEKCSSVEPYASDYRKACHELDLNLLEFCIMFTDDCRDQ